jgi:hypothetical protein
VGTNINHRRSAGKFPTTSLLILFTANQNLTISAHFPYEIRFMYQHSQLEWEQFPG